MKKYHTTKDGKKMLISDMETSHLNAMVKFIERKAEEGVTMVYGSAYGICNQDCDVEQIFGSDVLDQFGYRSYLKELKSRGVNHENAYGKYGIGAYMSHQDFYFDVLGHD